MNKIVLSVELHDERMKKKAMMEVAKIPGVESVSVDMKDKKLTVTGNSDPVCVVGKLRKRCHTDILSVGPAKETEKKEDKPKQDNKPKKEEEKKKDPTENCADLLRLCQLYYYHPPMGHPCYCTCGCVQEDPSICVIS